MNFAKFQKTLILEQLLLNQLGIMYILLSECLLEKKKEYKIKDNPSVFCSVICTCEQQYCKNKLQI